MKALRFDGKELAIEETPAPSMAGECLVPCA